MKPHRVRMAHSLVVTYGLNEQLDIYRPRMVTQEEMTQFHTDDYVHFLRNTTPDNMHEFLTQLQRFNVGEDCPLFDGLYDYCQLYTSGSVGGAVRLNNDQNDIVINWSGGLHHAKKGEASGFCYINDCVLCILELLKKYPRVLYIDIDIHHGDGVEEAFYTSDRVMTFSLHKYGDYFPGTGDVSDLGYGKGKGYAINFPLHDGMDDEAFVSIFRPIITSIMENFKPGAVCLQCGADSLAGDRLGCFNLSLRGAFCLVVFVFFCFLLSHQHPSLPLLFIFFLFCNNFCSFWFALLPTGHGDCVRFVKSFGLPTIVIGGGGYTIRNVARCWAYETSVLLDTPVPDELPINEYFEYYGPDYRLHIQPSNMENFNTHKYLQDTKNRLLTILRNIKPTSIGIQTGQAGTYQTPAILPPAPVEEVDPDERAVSDQSLGGSK